MSRKILINTRFWNSPSVIELLNEFERYFLLYCLTNSYNLTNGTAQISVEVMEKETGLKNEKLVYIIKTLIDNNFIDYDYNNKVLIIHCWNEYTSMAKSKRIIGDFTHRRTDSQYKKWQLNVFKRDNYKCQKCGGIENLNAHHVKRWCDNIELRFELTNGITLCQDCHKLVHKKENNNG